MADSDLKMTVSDDGSAIRVRLQGLISERVELDTSQIPPGRPVVIDVGDVNHMNSLGVRNWIRFLDTLCGRSPQVTLERLSPILVFQASMISTFLSRARVATFQSPWVCDNCGNAAVLAHTLEEDIPESVPCPKCKSAMEFDSDPDSYQTFRYLASQQG